MEIRRFYSVCFLKREMRKDLFNIDINNTTDEVSLLFLQLTNLYFSSEYKKINIDKWKKIN
jgi:hypothetical protein